MQTIIFTFFYIVFGFSDALAHISALQVLRNLLDNFGKVYETCIEIAWKWFGVYKCQICILDIKSQRVL